MYKTLYRKVIIGMVLWAVKNVFESQFMYITSSLTNPMLPMSPYRITEYMHCANVSQ